MTVPLNPPDLDDLYEIERERDALRKEVALLRDAERLRIPAVIIVALSMALTSLVWLAITIDRMDYTKQQCSNAAAPAALGYKLRQAGCSSAATCCLAPCAPVAVPRPTPKP